MLLVASPATVAAQEGLASRPGSRQNASGPTTLHVPADYPTIQAALDAALGGHEILVSPGTYHERLLFPPLQLRLCSVSGPADTVIDGLGAGGSVIRFLSGATNDSIVEGFTLTGGLAAYGGGISCDPGAEPSILGNWILDNHATFDGGGIFPRPECCVVIVGNWIGGNTAAGQGGGLQTPALGSTINKNVFTYNRATYGGALFIRRESGGGIANNTFYRNEATYGSVCAGDGSLALFNCIAWGNIGDPVYLYGGGALVTRYSLIEGGLGQPWFGIGCLDQDPIFVAPEQEDLRLRGASPCIDTGDPGAPLDPDGSRADMGALPFLHRHKTRER